MARRTIFSLLTLAMAALGADPVIGTITVTPTFAPANIATQVTLTVVIDDPTLTPNGADVQQLNATGNPTAVLGILHDDGLNGDLVAGDHIYTLAFTLTEPTAGRILFRVSGAFQGIVQRVPSSAIAVDIANASSPLTIDAATAPAPNAAGWNHQDVTVSFSCAGGAGGSDLCPGIVPVTTEGRAQTISGIAIDGSGNTATKTVTVNLDKTGPILNITSPENGAVVATPTLTLTGTVTDPLSGVASFTCNGQTASLSGSDFSCNLQLVPGSNAITVQATDIAGNTSTTNLAVTFSVTSLTISASATPLPNASGWNDTDVTVVFACAGGAAPVNCPPSVVISNEGGNQVISRTATDALGSTASASVTLKIDKTRPALTIISPTAAATVTTQQLTVTGTALDTLSGLARVMCNSTTATLSGSNFSCNLALVPGPNTIAVQATDVAGNTATSSLSVTLGTALTISAAPSPAPNAAGWNNSNVTVTFTCAGGVGTVTCPPPVTVSSEGLGQIISRTASDSGGNSVSASVTLKIDKTPPTLAISSPTPAATVTSPQITISGTLSDTLSGVASATCNGSPAALTQGNLSCSRSLIAGLNTIIVQAIDVAGNSTAISLPITLSTSALTISATASPARNAAGWNNANVTVTFACAGGTGAVTCPQPVVVSTEGANQTVSRTASDSAGDNATASVTLKIDKTPPSLTISSPANGTIVLTSPVAVTGTISDTLSGVAAVTCNGIAAIVSSAGFTCSVTLTSGANAVTISATDVAGNSQVVPLNLMYGAVATVTFTAPANLSYLNISPTTVTGTVSDSSATVTINSIPAAVLNGQFSIALPLAEGPNIITATATTPSGAAGTSSIQVTLDTTPPQVTITSPPDGFVTTDSSISVAGNVNDIVVGTVNDQQAQVAVNGTAAQVANRTFLATNVPLTLGSNTIQAVGRDRAGNAATTQISVARQAPSRSSQIQLVSGNNQSAAIGSVLSAPLVVALTDANGNPAPNKPVIFKVTQDDGLVGASGTPASALVATTNAQGQAQVQWTLGNRAGAGENIVEAYAVGFSGTAIFTATGNQGPAGKIVVDSGNNQVSAVNQPLPRPLIAVVVDAGNNRLANVPVTFTVIQGGGTLSSQGSASFTLSPSGSGPTGQTSVTVNSDSDGRVAAILTLGLQEGDANNLVQASFVGNQGFPASFTASGRAPGDPSKTTISGVVLDNSSVPIPGVTIRAVLTNLLNSNSTSVQTAADVQTNAQGQFTIPQAPVGFVKLLVDGSTAQLPGTYPSLDYDMVTVAGQNNTVGNAIYLLPLNPSNQLCVTATTGGGTLTIPEAPGFSLTFGPGQVTFPGGSTTGCVSVTAVHGDKVPMTPGFGQQPRFIVTIQPSGALFNPPAPIALPNVDGLKPREVTEMYSFDHDIGSFVAIGTGTVSDDGQVIRSNSGVGVLKAGWHCGGNPTTNGSAATCGTCAICNGNSCVPDPTLAGQSCPNPCVIGGPGTCNNGSCAGQDQPLGFVCGVQQICDGTGSCIGSGGNCGICNGGNPCIDSSCGPNGQCIPTVNQQCQTGCVQGQGCVVQGTSGTCDNGFCDICNSLGAGATCTAGGGLPGTCASDGHGGLVCKGSGNQCPVSCNGGTCTNGICNPVTITQDKQLWYFGGENPRGFTDGSIAVTLTASGASAGNFEWTILAGQDKAIFPNGTSVMTTTLNTVGLQSSAPSSQLQDIEISLTLNGSFVASYRLEVRAPTRIRHGTDIDAGAGAFCNVAGTEGFLSIIPYDLLTQFDELVTTAPVNEHFGTKTDVESNNWIIPNAVAGLSAADGSFSDTICVTDSVFTPQPLPPVLASLSTRKIDFIIQQLFAGSLTSGRGILLQTEDFTRFIDHGRHLNIR